MCDSKESRHAVMTRLNTSQSQQKQEIQSKDQESQIQQKVNCQIQSNAQDLLFKQKVDQCQIQDNQRPLTAIAKLKPLIPSKKMHSIYVMYINGRVRMQFPQKESLKNILSKLIHFFGIENQISSTVGLVYRIRDKNYKFIEQECDLVPDCLYFLYFKENVLSKKHQTVDGFLHKLSNDQDDEGWVQSDSEGEDMPNLNNSRDCQKKNDTEKSNTSLIEEDKNGRKVKFSTQKEQLKDSEADLKQQDIRESKRRLKSQQQNEFDLTCIQRVKRPKNEMKLLMCPFVRCLKEFSETGNLKTHMRTHTGERPFKCTQCNQFFITKGHLQAHELTHTGQKPFVCTFHGCNKRYSRAGRLKIHARIHTGEKPFVCTLSNCEKSFREKGNLLTHMRMHQNQSSYNSSAPYDLNQCQRQVNYQGYKRSCKCSLCGTSFSVLSELREHQKKHCLKCKICGRIFQESNNFAAHQMTHANQQNFPQPTMSQTFQNYLVENFDKTCHQTGSLKEDEQNLQTFDDNLQCQNRRIQKRKAKEVARQNIAETYNEYGNNRNHQKFQNDEAYSCHQSSGSISHHEPSKTLTFQNRFNAPQIEKMLINEDKSYTREKIFVNNPDFLALKQPKTVERHRGHGVNHHSPDITDKFSIFAPTFQKSLVNNHELNRNEEANQAAQQSINLHAQHSSNSISNLIGARDDRRANFQPRNVSAQAGQGDHQQNFQAAIPFLTNLERQGDYREQVLSPSVILGRQQTFGPILTGQNQNGQIREEHRNHYQKNFSSLFPSNNDNFLKSIISPLHPHSEEADKEKPCMGQPRSFIHTLNLTSNRVVHQHQMGHDSDLHSELSGLANNSQGEQQWPQKEHNLKQSYQNVLDALCDQLARQQEAEGQQYELHMNGLVKPQTDDNKYPQNLIASPVYVYKQKSQSDNYVEDLQRPNVSQELYDRSQLQKDVTYLRNEKLQSDQHTNSRKSGQNRPTGDQKVNNFRGVLTSFINESKFAEGKSSHIQKQNVPSSPILPISVIQEPSREILGLPVGPFSGAEDLKDQICEKRERNHYPDGLNILSPTQELGSLGEISPCNKPTRLQNNQKIVLNYPNKYYRNDAEHSGRQPSNLHSDSNCFNQQIGIEAFACQNQISGSTKPHTAKRSPELLQSEMNQK